MYLFIPSEQLSLKRACPPSRHNQEEEKVSDLKVTKVSGNMCNEFQGVSLSFLRLLAKMCVVIQTARQRNWRNLKASPDCRPCLLLVPLALSNSEFVPYRGWFSKLFAGIKLLT